MRSRLRLAIATSLTAIVLCGGAPAAAAPAQSGITITPAALRLELAAGHTTATTSFTVTNHYPSAVTLAFTLEAEKAGGKELSAAELHRLVAISQTAMALGAGQTQTQSLTLTDNRELPPGSQALSLVVSQQGVSGAGSVGVAAQIRLPLALVKEAGAVRTFAVTKLETPGWAWTLPASARVSLHNTGNTALIPRGFVVVTDPNDTVVAKGTLNTASLAVGPGADLTLQTPLTQLVSARLPGPYKATVIYGLGGDQAVGRQVTTLWFMAWWHVAGVLIGLLLLYYGVRAALQVLHVRRILRRQPPPERVLLIGRDIT